MHMQTRTQLPESRNAPFPRTSLSSFSTSRELTSPRIFRAKISFRSELFPVWSQTSSTFIAFPIMGCWSIVRICRALNPTRSAKPLQSRAGLAFSIDNSLTSLCSVMYDSASSTSRSRIDDIVLVAQTSVDTTTFGMQSLHKYLQATPLVCYVLTSHLTKLLKYTGKNGTTSVYKPAFAGLLTHTQQTPCVFVGRAVCPSFQSLCRCL